MTSLYAFNGVCKSVDADQRHKGACQAAQAWQTYLAAKLQVLFYWDMAGSKSSLEHTGVTGASLPKKPTQSCQCQTAGSLDCTCAMSVPNKTAAHSKASADTIMLLIIFIWHCVISYRWHLLMCQQTRVEYAIHNSLVACHHGVTLDWVMPRPNQVELSLRRSLHQRQFQDPQLACFTRLLCSLIRYSLSLVSKTAQDCQACSGSTTCRCSQWDAEAL